MIDDEESVCEILKFNLEKEGYEVDCAYSAEEALDMDLDGYSLFMVDIMMGELSGFDFAKRIRNVTATEDVPILFCSALSDEDDVVKGLNIGADDYVTKPFRPLELIARVKAQLRRYNKYTPVPTENEPVTLLAYKKLMLNTKTYECELDGESLSLTPTEFSILRILLENQGAVVTLEELFHRIWKDEYYSKNSSTITVHIRHLREKLKDTTEKPKYIKTIWGVGYKI